MATKFETVGLPQSVTQQGQPEMPTVAGLSGKSMGAGHFRTLELSFSNMPISMVDEAGVVAYGSQKIVDMPEGAIVVLGAVANLTFTEAATGINADFDGDFGIGTTAAGNNNALATTEQDIIQTTATVQAVSSVAVAKAVRTGAPAAFDGTVTPVDLYLNLLIDDADQNIGAGPAIVNVNGTVTLHYLYQGNH